MLDGTGLVQGQCGPAEGREEGLTWGGAAGSEGRAGLAEYLLQHKTNSRRQSGCHCHGALLALT